MNDRPRMAVPDRELEPVSTLSNFLPHIVQSNRGMAVLGNAHAHFYKTFLVELRRRRITCDRPKRPDPTPLTEGQTRRKRKPSEALDKTHVDTLMVLLEELDVPRCSDTQLVTLKLSVGYIADQCGRWPGTVQRAIEDLMASGIVDAEIAGRGIPNIYRLTLPEQSRTRAKKLPQKGLNKDARIARARVLKLHRCVNPSRTGAYRPHAPVREEPHAPAQFQNSGNSYSDDDFNNSSTSSSGGAAEGGSGGEGESSDLAMAAAVAELRNREIGEETIRQLLDRRPARFLIAASLCAGSGRINNPAGFIIAAARGKEGTDVPFKFFEQADKLIESRGEALQIEAVKALSDFDLQLLIDAFLQEQDEPGKRRWIEENRNDRNLILSKNPIVNRLAEIYAEQQ